MKIIRLDRQQGKTTKLIKMSNEKWIYIICSTRQRVEHIVNMAYELNIDIPFPIHVSELPLRNHLVKEVLIDDFDELLQILIGKPVLLATTSCEIVRGR